MSEPAGDSHIRYRPEVDGLRAVAVLAVVASHVQLNHFEGGYVGVDVFFVISGYLIGSILLREVERTGRISYTDFYERRIRRILPALLAMLVAVAAVAYTLLLPKDLDEFARMAVATLVFGANIYLSQSGGYFGADAAFNFLTHTWSLGVEEQFYIVLPPLLMLFRKQVAAGHGGRLIVAIALLSFLVSIPAVHFAPTGTFYLLPTRIWELLLGTLAYLHAPRVAQWPARVQALLAASGITMILVPTLLYTTQTPFPGLTALPPCLGTALLIATRATVMHRVLSMRPWVFIGQISYSLYLWHWPIVVYNRLYPFLGNAHPRVVKVAMVLLSLLLAYLSWRWIETPFRRGGLRLSGGRLFAATGAFSAALMVALFAVIATSGATYRFTPAEQRIAAYRENGGSMANFRVGQCFIEEPSATRLPDPAACLSTRTDRPNVLLFGSSFVAQMHAAFRDTYPEANFLQATSPGCVVQRPAPGTAVRGCGALMNYLFNEFLPAHRMDAVFFQVDRGDPSPAVLADVLAYFRAQGTRVYVMGPQVRYDRPGPLLAISSARDPQDFRLADHLSGISASDDAPLRARVEEGGGTYLSMFEAVCPGGTCRAFADGEVPMQADRAHLTLEGSLAVVRGWRARSLIAWPAR